MYIRYNSFSGALQVETVTAGLDKVFFFLAAKSKNLYLLLNLIENFLRLVFFIYNQENKLTKLGETCNYVFKN